MVVSDSSNNGEESKHISPFTFARVWRTQGVFMIIDDHCMSFWTHEKCDPCQRCKKKSTNLKVGAESHIKVSLRMTPINRGVHQTPLLMSFLSDSIKILILPSLWDKKMCTQQLNQSCKRWYVVCIYLMCIIKKRYVRHAISTNRHKLPSFLIGPPSAAAIHWTPAVGFHPALGCYPFKKQVTIGPPRSPPSPKMWVLLLGHMIECRSIKRNSDLSGWFIDQVLLRMTLLLQHQ